MYTMKKRNGLIALALISIMLLAGCGKYTVDTGQSPEILAKHGEKLEAALQTLKESVDPDEIDKYEFEVAFQYQMLGKYDKALKYYKKLLGKYPNYDVVLNNMGAIEEEVGELEKAERHLFTLANGDIKNREAQRDYLRVLVKQGKTDPAKIWLEEWAKMYPSELKDDSFVRFVSDQFITIQSYKK